MLSDPLALQDDRKRPLRWQRPRRPRLHLGGASGEGRVAYYIYTRQMGVLDSGLNERHKQGSYHAACRGLVVAAGGGGPRSKRARATAMARETSGDGQ
jgi:hypothetical protein